MLVAFRKRFAGALAYALDGAVNLLTDGTGPGPGRYLSNFPYVGTPHDGYDTPSV